MSQILLEYGINSQVKMHFKNSFETHKKIIWRMFDSVFIF